MRFTHANRHCPDHPYATLTRSDDFVLKPVSGNTELPHDVTRWLERYKLAREREDRTPTGKDRKKKPWKTSSENRKKSRKGLMMDSAGEQENLDRGSSNQRVYCSESQDSQEDSQDDEPIETCTVLQNSEDEESVAATKLPVTPVRRILDRLQPKKRWLREACLEQQLAKPLRWDSQPTGTLNSCNEGLGDRLSTDLTAPSSWNVSCVRNLAVQADFNLLEKSDDKQELNKVNYSITKDATWNQVTSSTTTDTIIPSEELIFDNRNLVSQAHWDPIQSVDQPDTTKIIEQEQPIITRHPENEMRPTVLMLAGSLANNSNKEPIRNNQPNKSSVKVVLVKQENNLLNLPIPEDNQKWLGALALMELAKTEEEAAKARLLSKGLVQQQDVYSEFNYTHL